MVERKHKEFKRASYSILEEASKVLGRTEHELCLDCGYSSTNVSRWREENEIPFTMSLALECLRRRQGPSASQPWVLVVRGSTSHEKLAVEGVVKALNLTVKEV